MTCNSTGKLLSFDISWKSDKNVSSNYTQRLKKVIGSCGAVLKPLPSLPHGFETVLSVHYIHLEELWVVCSEEQSLGQKSSLRHMALISQLMYQCDEEIQLFSITIQLNPLQGHRDSKKVSWKSTGVLFSQVLCPAAVSGAQTAVGPKNKALSLMHGMSGNEKADVCPGSSTSCLQAYKDKRHHFTYGFFCMEPASSAQAQPAGSQAGNQWPQEQTRNCEAQGCSPPQASSDALEPVSQGAAGVSQGLAGLEQSQQRGLSQTGHQSCAQRLLPCATRRTKLLWWKSSPLIVPFTCLGTQLCAVSDGQLFVSMTSGFMCLWERGSLDNSLHSAPVGSWMLKSCSPQLEFLLTCLSLFSCMVPIQPQGTLQLLKIICIPAPGHVDSKDDRMGQAQPFCSAGNSSSRAALLSWGHVWL